MVKTVHIVAELMLENSEMPINLIQERILNETKIPLCNSIKEITVDDMKDYCESLKKKGVSISVIDNLIQHFYNE